MSSKQVGSTAVGPGFTLALALDALRCTYKNHASVGAGGLAHSTCQTHCNPGRHAAVNGVEPTQMPHSDKIPAINYQIDNLNPWRINRSSESPTSVLQAIQPTIGNPSEQPSVASILPTVIILASGRGERFSASGGATHKLQAMLIGKTVLQHTLDAVRGSNLPWHLEAESHPGMGDSIAIAVQKTPKANGWLILPADLPLIQSSSLKAVAFALLDHEVVVPVYRGQRGHPVGFSVGCRQALLDLRGDRGAARVVQAHTTMELHLDDMGCVTDIDTVEDLQVAASLLSRTRPITISLGQEDCPRA